MYKKIKELIEQYDNIIIHRHSRPDGDAIGSQMGLKELIKFNYPSKNVYAVGDLSNKFSFIEEIDIINDCIYDNALVFVLDSAEEFLISDLRYKKNKNLIKIDHHIPRGKFADIELVDTSFESCAGLITDFAINSGLNFNQKAAKCLFTGIVTDSGRFRYSSTNSRTLKNAAKLLEYDIKITEIYDNLYMDDLELVKLRAKYTLNFNISKGGVAYLMNTKEDVKNSNVDFFTISRGMVNTMAGIKGLDIWVNFTEDEENNCVVAEIRSSKYDINKVAVKYGGGGHLQASGASLKNFDEAYEMIKDLEKVLEENSGN